MRRRYKMFKQIGLQCLLALIASLIMGVLFGRAGAWSAALGGAVCVIPSGLFALRLRAARGRAASAYVVSFFVGELLKLALCVGLLVMVHRAFPSLHWAAFIAGLIVTYQANFFAFLIKT